MGRRDELIVGLDIGTTKICAVVVEANGESLEVVGIGSHPSKGLRNGVVIDIDGCRGVSGEGSPCEDRQ